MQPNQQVLPSINYTSPELPCALDAANAKDGQAVCKASGGACAGRGATGGRRGWLLGRRPAGGSWAGGRLALRRVAIAPFTLTRHCLHPGQQPPPAPTHILRT